MISWRTWTNIKLIRCWWLKRGGMTMKKFCSLFMATAFPWVAAHLHGQHGVGNGFFLDFFFTQKILLFLFTWGSANSRFHLEVPARIHVPSAKDLFSCKGIKREAHSVARPSRGTATVCIICFFSSPLLFPAWVSDQDCFSGQPLPRSWTNAWDAGVGTFKLRTPVGLSSDEGWHQCNVDPRQRDDTDILGTCGFGLRNDRKWTMAHWLARTGLVVPNRLGPQIRFEDSPNCRRAMDGQLVQIDYLLLLFWCPGALLYAQCFSCLSPNDFFAVNKPSAVPWWWCDLLWCHEVACRVRWSNVGNHSHWHIWQT